MIEDVSIGAAHSAPVLHPLTISVKGVEFIARFEGFRPLPYNDPAQNATIGFGHLLHLGPVNAADRARWVSGLSRPAALQLLSHDCYKAEVAIRELVKVHLTQPQFDSLCSFVYNVGARAFQSSMLLRELNVGGYSQVPGELSRWVHAGGKVEIGLVVRRRAEGEVWAHAEYGK